MVMSVNTNPGAMIALQSLAKTNMFLEMTQLRITTGLRVNGPKDDAAIFAIAQNMRGDIAGMSAVKTNLSLGQSVVSVAIDAGKAIEDLLIDRLRAWVHWRSDEDGRWTRRLAALHRHRIDWRYVRERTAAIPEEAAALRCIEGEIAG